MSLQVFDCAIYMQMTSEKQQWLSALQFFVKQFTNSTDLTLFFLNESHTISYKEASKHEHFYFICSSFVSL